MSCRENIEASKRWPVQREVLSGPVRSLTRARPFFRQVHPHCCVPDSLFSFAFSHSDLVHGLSRDSSLSWVGTTVCTTDAMTSSSYSNSSSLRISPRHFLGGALSVPWPPRCTASATYLVRSGLTGGMGRKENPSPQPKLRGTVHGTIGKSNGGAFDKRSNREIKVPRSVQRPGGSINLQKQFPSRALATSPTQSLKYFYLPTLPCFTMHRAVPITFLPFPAIARANKVKILGSRNPRKLSLRLIWFCHPTTHHSLSATWPSFVLRLTAWFAWSSIKATIRLKVFLPSLFLVVYSTPETRSWIPSYYHLWISPQSSIEYRYLLYPSLPCGPRISRCLHPHAQVDTAPPRLGRIDWTVWCSYSWEEEEDICSQSHVTEACRECSLDRPHFQIVSDRRGRVNWYVIVEAVADQCHRWPNGLVKHSCREWDGTLSTLLVRWQEPEQRQGGCCWSRLELALFQRQLPIKQPKWVVKNSPATHSKITTDMFRSGAFKFQYFLFQLEFVESFASLASLYSTISWRWEERIVAQSHTAKRDTMDSAYKSSVFTFSEPILRFWDTTSTAYVLLFFSMYA